MGRGHRTVVSLLTTVVSSLGVVVALPHGATASSGLRGGDPAAATVSSRCWGGPGVMVMTVRPVATTDDVYRIQVTARRVVDGSRWRVKIGDLVPMVTVHRRAIVGRWSATTRLAANGELFYEGEAHEQGRRPYGCQLSSSQIHYPIANTRCRRPHLHVEMSVRQPEHDVTLVKNVLYSDRPLVGRWHVTMAARRAGRIQTVTFDGVGHHGVVISHVDFHGIGNPRLRVDATREGGVHCTLTLNPPDVTDTG